MAASEIRDTLAAADEKLVLDGVENFGRLSEHLYRGAQPRVDAYASLRAFGIDTIVRLSTGDEFIAGERERVEALGMRFVSLPWRAADTPTPEQVAAFLTLFRERPAQTVFVHCREGADRTGVMIALYRIAIDHFTADRAVAEMKAFHYRYLFHPHLQEFVEAFPANSALTESLDPGDQGR
ncbi:MAG: tyrosine-protein phosphatase [Vicinamibacterales bacterium]